MGEAKSGEGGGGGKEISVAAAEKLRADLLALRRAVRECRRCAGSSGGVPGHGKPGSPLFLLSGMPGPAATSANPWGSWWEEISSRARDEWGWDKETAYLSTALRCSLGRVTHKEVQRCSVFLAEELLIVGPRLVLVSGKVASVALQEALGGGVPVNPKAGDAFTLFNTTFLYNLDVARVWGDEEAARVFRRILREAQEFLGR